MPLSRRESVPDRLLHPHLRTGGRFATPDGRARFVAVEHDPPA